MKYTVTKEFWFTMAHRLGCGYTGPCKNNHGHEYKVEVTLSSKKLNQFGFVVDFKEVAERMKAWVMENWDHATLVQKDDQHTLNHLRTTNQKHYVFPLQNTTAELMAEFLYRKAVQLFTPLNVKVEQIALWETATSKATYGG